MVLNDAALRTITISFLLVAVISANPVRAQCMSQTAKLIGTDVMGAPRFGNSVAISGDGNTLLVGSPDETTLAVGAVYVFIRSGGTWIQQGAPLVPTGFIGPSQFGWSVALSADGNTALIGAYGDNGAAGAGAAYVFVRSGNTWTQQVKLLPTGSGARNLGSSVSLSSNGNTALVGAYQEDNQEGRAYVFVRSGTTWTLQRKFGPSNGLGGGQFGWCASISGDGSTALVGAPLDNSFIGAAYVFTRSGTEWSQQTKLVSTGGVGVGQFGYSISVSNDSNTAIIGAWNESNFIGAVYAFVRSGSVWTQQARLTPTGFIGQCGFGTSVAASANGNTGLIGAHRDNNGIGATFVVNRVGTNWSQPGPKLVPVGGIGPGDFGVASSLSLDGNSAVVGASVDNFIGAAYVLGLNVPVTFAQHPVGQVVQTGGTATYTVMANSNVPLSYQWRRNGINLANGPSGTGSTIAGANTATLLVTSVGSGDNAAAFDCVVTTSCASERSNAAGLAVAACTGDFNNDNVTDGNDIQGFVNALLSGDACP